MIRTTIQIGSTSSRKLPPLPMLDKISICIATYFLDVIYKLLIEMHYVLTLINRLCLKRHIIICRCVLFKRCAVEVIVVPVYVIYFGLHGLETAGGYV